MEIAQKLIDSLIQKANGLDAEGRRASHNAEGVKMLFDALVEHSKGIDSNGTEVENSVSESEKN